MIWITTSKNISAKNIVIDPELELFLISTKSVTCPKGQLEEKIM